MLPLFLVPPPLSSLPHPPPLFSGEDTPLHSYPLPPYTINIPFPWGIKFLQD